MPLLDFISYLKMIISFKNLYRSSVFVSYNHGIQILLLNTCVSLRIGLSGKIIKSTIFGPTFCPPSKKTNKIHYWKLYLYRIKLIYYLYTIVYIVFTAVSNPDNFSTRGSAQFFFIGQWSYILELYYYLLVIINYN